MQAAALAAESEAILRAIMSPDDFGRMDVLSTLLSLPAVFVEPRHDAALFSAPHSLHVSDPFGLLSWQHDRTPPSDDWRIKPRTKTVCAVLVMCLNLGIEPPGPPKVPPFAVLECWLDPNKVAGPQDIISAVHAQFLRLMPRAKFKLICDPTTDEMHSMASLRRSVDNDRVVFHYNGHGVPKPTSAGEIWVFNRDYTQYMPLPVPELQRLIGQPGMFIFDCDHAGHLVPFFAETDEAFASCGHKARDVIGVDPALIDGNDPRYRREWIVFASCGPLETLPTSPDYPADLFTSCLTTPLKVALRAAVQRNSPILPSATVELVDRIPGELSDRHTPLGELNWVFTTITDTIAWSVCPRPLFLRLFRHDLCVAPLFRNFLFADRMMRVAGVTPLSYPKLPPTHTHPLWDAFDIAVDLLLSRTVQLESAQKAAAAKAGAAAPHPSPAPATVGVVPQPPPADPLPPVIEKLISNKKLEDELASPTKSTKSSGTAKSDKKRSGKEGKEKKSKKSSGKDGESRTGKSKGHKKHKSRDKGDGDSVRRADKDGRSSAVGSVAGDVVQPPPPLFPPTTFFDEQLTAFSMWIQYGKHAPDCTPPQLPVLLQSLLTQERRHALMLLARFMDLGAWAVRCALEVGMFPYLLKLLKSSSHDTHSVLVYVFSKLLAFDPRCRNDLLDADDHGFFVKYLSDRVPANTNVYPFSTPAFQPAPAPVTTPALPTEPQHPFDVFAVPDDQRCNAMFVACKLMEGDTRGQRALLQAGLLPVLIKLCYAVEPTVLQWACLAMHTLCDGCVEAVNAAVIYAEQSPAPMPTSTRLDAATAFVGLKSDSQQSRHRLRSRSSLSQSIERVPPLFVTLKRLTGHPHPDVRAAACVALHGLLPTGSYDTFATAHIVTDSSSLSSAAAVASRDAYDLSDQRHPAYVSASVGIADFCRRHPPIIVVHRLTRQDVPASAMQHSSSRALLDSRRKPQEPSIIDELSPSQAPLVTPSAVRIDALVLPPSQSVTTPRSASQDRVCSVGGPSDLAVTSSFMFPDPPAGEGMVNGPPPPDLLLQGLMLSAQMSKDDGNEAGASHCRTPSPATGLSSPKPSSRHQINSMSPGGRRKETATLSSYRPPSAGGEVRTPSAPTVQTRGMLSSAPTSPSTRPYFAPEAPSMFSVGKNKRSGKALNLLRPPTTPNPSDYRHNAPSLLSGFSAGAPDSTFSIRRAISDGHRSVSPGPTPSLISSATVPPLRVSRGASEKDSDGVVLSLPPPLRISVSPAPAPLQPPSTIPLPPPPVIAKPPPPFQPLSRQLQDLCIAMYLVPNLVDASPLVRQQALLGIVRLVSAEPHAAAWKTIVTLQRDRSGPSVAVDSSDAEGKGVEGHSTRQHAPLVSPAATMSGGDGIPLKRAMSATTADDRPIAALSNALSEIGYMDKRDATVLTRDAKPRRVQKPFGGSVRRMETGVSIPNTRSPSLGSVNATPQFGPNGSVKLSQSSSADSLFRRASELLGPACASLYVALFKVVLYCRNDPFPTVADISKSLLGYDTPTAAAVPCLRALKQLPITASVFETHAELQSRLYRWACWRQHSGCGWDDDPAYDVLSAKTLAQAAQLRAMQSGFRNATVLAATMFPHPPSALASAASLALQVQAHVPRNGSLQSMQSHHSAQSSFYNASMPAQGHVLVQPSPMLSALAAPFSPGHIPLFPHQQHPSASDATLSSHLSQSPDGFVPPPPLATLSPTFDIGDSYDESSRFMMPSASPQQVAEAADGFQAVFNEVVDDGVVAEGHMHDSNEVFGPGSLRLSADVLATVPVSAVSRAMDAMSEMKEKVVLRHEAGRSINIVRFHPWNDTLLTIDDRSVGHVWNHAKGMKVREFPLHSSKFEATSALWLNEQSDPLLAIGSSNGIVRVYQGVGDISSELRLVTAFTGMPEMGASVTGSGLIMEVEPRSSLLYTAGSSTSLRIWDVNREQCVGRLHACDSNACVTSLASPWPGVGLVLIGDSLGRVSLLDNRCPTTPAVNGLATPAWVGTAGSTNPVGGGVMYDLHTRDGCGWIINVASPRSGSGYSAVSGSANGEMCLWDLRVASPVSVVQATRPDMSCLAVHNFAPLIAAGSSDKRYIQIMDLHGEQIERLLYHSGFAGKTLGPIRCLDFHNTSMLLAAGTADHDVSVFEGTQPV